MLTLPSLPLDCAASVYADDTNPNLFYAVPVAPRIRRDDRGGAAIVFYKYRAIPPGATEATGGGFLEFQTELVLDDAERAGIARLLRARPGAGTAEPILRAPTYIDGTADLVTFSPAPGGMVEAVEGSAHPSLFDDNAAAFALKLSRDGAALLWTQLRTTPSPVAVRYSLTMLARLPPGRVHVWLRAGPLRDAWAELAPLDPATARPGALASRGIAGVEVLDWPPAGEAGMDELKEQLVRWGWDLLDQRAQGALTGPGQQAPDWAQVTDVDMTLTGRSTIPWPVRPGATLAGVAGGSFLEVDVGDPIFDVLRVEARCNADFDGNRIAAITLRLRYGDHHHDVLFTDNTTTDVFKAVVDPRLGRTYTYSAVVQFAQTSHTLELPEVTADGEQLLLSVGEVGRVRIDVVGTAVDWSRTDVVEVHLTYADPARGVAAQEDVAVLRQSQPEVRYERAVWVPVDQPWQYRAVHVLRDGRRVEPPAQARTGRVVVVQEPFTRFLTVRLQAPAGFATVAMHLVECEHEWAGGTVRETFRLTAGTASATWSVGLLPDEPERFRYRVSTTFSDGHMEPHDWVPAAGSQTIAVGGAPTSLLEVTVAGDVLDYTVVKLAQVSLRHTTPGGEEHSHSLLFQPSRHDQQVWTVPLAAGDRPSYSWSAQFYLTDGSRRSIPTADSSERVLVLQLPPA